MGVGEVVGDMLRRKSGGSFASLRTDYPFKYKMGNLLFLFFPMSFFLGAIYNESLFLFLIFSCFFFAKKQTGWR